MVLFSGGNLSTAEVAKLIEVLMLGEQELNLSELTLPIDKSRNMSQMLSQLGDRIVSLLVSWMRRLPFTQEISKYKIPLTLFH